MSVKARIKRLEVRCGIVEEQPEVIDLGNGVCFTMTRSEFGRLIDEIAASGTSGRLPVDVPPGQSADHAEEDLPTDRRYALVRA